MKNPTNLSQKHKKNWYALKIVTNSAMLRIGVHSNTHATNKQLNRETQINTKEMETTTDTKNELQLLRMATHEC